MEISCIKILKHRMKSRPHDLLSIDYQTLNWIKELVLGMRICMLNEKEAGSERDYKTAFNTSYGIRALLPFS
jgi:hypothetical protein